MPLQSATQFGEEWVCGFQASDAPNICTGFQPVENNVDYEPEKYSTSENGEGHVDSVTVTKKNKRKGTATFTGKITSDYNPLTVPESFPWNDRLWIVKKAPRPLKKGEYAEVAIEAESFALVGP